MPPSGGQTSLPNEDGVVSADRQVFEQMQRAARDADGPKRFGVHMRHDHGISLLLAGGDLRKLSRLPFVL